MIWSRRGLNGDWGRADFERKTISCAPVTTLWTLYIYLHECGHAHLQHGERDIGRVQMEYEAEQFALHTLRAEGLPVPLQFTLSARWNVGNHVIAADKAGERIPKGIRKWARRRPHEEKIVGLLPPDAFDIFAGGR